VFAGDFSGVFFCVPAADDINNKVKDAIVPRIIDLLWLDGAV